MTAPIELARKLIGILAKDESRLRRIDDYLHGQQDDPYMPATADDEYKLLARRSISNWMPLLVSTPAQALYVDSFRRGRGQESRPDTDVLPEWEHWQRSRLDARQAAIYRGALAYGHAFTITERVRGRVVTKGLSALKTAALFEDAANDDVPYAALTVTRHSGGDGKPGEARMWDGTHEYKVTYTSWSDLKSVQVTSSRPHGASECPITRFAAAVDLEGRTTGVIEPMIAVQNRINQSVFDLLVAQTGGSFTVRYATGMAPPLQMRPIYANPADPTSAVIGQEPVLDDAGNPIPAPVNLNAKRFLFGEDPEVRFGQLDGTPLDGYIESIDMSIRHLAAVSQTPPHHLLGQIANLSAEALQAAETSLSRKIAEFRTAFGESWERVFRLAAEMDGNVASAEDFAGEAIWRDMESRSLAQAADALGKLKEQLGIPDRGLWRRVPGVTQTELDDWEDMRSDDPALALSSSIRRATPDRPSAPQVLGA